MISLILVSMMSLPAWGDSTLELKYTLSLNEKEIGHRDVTVQYFGTGIGQDRMIKSWTEMEISLPGVGFSYKQRLSGFCDAHGSPFNSITSEQGINREIQAINHVDGWTVNIVGEAQGGAYQYSRGEFDITSLDFLDPSAEWRDPDLAYLSVLAAETGTVFSGAFEQVGTRELTIGGQSVLGTVWLWHLGEGVTELVYDEQGHLLRYTMEVMGRLSVVATLEQVPVNSNDEFSFQPIFGTVIKEESIDLGAEIKEESL